WTRRKALDQVQNLKLYLYVATRNFSLNYCRDRQKHAHLDLDQMKIDLKELSIDPETRILDMEQLRLMNDAVQQLPNRCKVIFKLVKEDGLKQKEVAELLHLAPKTIENQLAIAIKRLAQAIGREMPQNKEPGKRGIGGAS
ncbi:MAG TPA: sigma-70 family RNA polymerase sigma factor, partial [Phnomibacter sp.]|nr:sigma-70 family RNA polymerase sigma factor [Phnomibacter sp.]